MVKTISKYIEKYKNMSAAAKASLWFVFCGFLQKGISVITTPIFTRLFTTAEYGQYNTFNSWMNIIGVIITLRLGYSAYMQGLFKFEEDQKRYTSSLLGLTICLIGAFTLLYSLFSSQLSAFLELSPIMIVCLSVLLLMATSFEFWSAKHRVEFEYRKIVALTVTMSILNPVLGIVAVSAFPRDRVTARIVETTIVELCCYGPLLVKQFMSGKCFYDRKYWKYALTFSIPLIPHYLSQTILNQSDRIMINKICGASEAGIYSLAYNVATILVLVNTSLDNSYAPWLYKHIKENKLEKSQQVSTLMVAIVAVLNLILILFAPEAVLFFGSAKYYEAIWVILPVAVGVYFMFLYTMFVKVEIYYGKTKYMMLASSVGAVLNLILNAIFIPIIGYMAAAYTTLACYIVYCLMHLRFVLKISKENLPDIQLYDFKNIIICTILFCTVAFMLMLTYSHAVIRYGVVAIGVVLCVIFRNKLSPLVKQILSLKKR